MQHYLYHFLLDEWNPHFPEPNSVYHMTTLARLPPSQPLDTIRKSNFRRTKIVDLQMAFFFLLGSKLRSPLISLACHKYPCLLSQDLGWTWAGGPGGSRLQCAWEQLSLANPVQSLHRDAFQSLLILRNWVGAWLRSTNIYRVPVTRSAWYHVAISVPPNSPKASWGALISDRWGTWVHDELWAAVWLAAWATVNCGCCKVNELTYPK